MMGTDAFDVEALLVLDARLSRLERALVKANGGDSEDEDGQTRVTSGTRPISEKVTSLAGSWQSKVNDTEFATLLSEYDALDKLCNADNIAIEGLSMAGKLEILLDALPMLQSFAQLLNELNELQKYINTDSFQNIPGHIQQLRPIEMRIAELNLSSDVLSTKITTLLAQYHQIIDQLSETFIQWDTALSKLENPALPQR